VRRPLLLVGAVVVILVAAVVGINRAVDPKGEFYSGGPVDAALSSRCLVGDDLVARTYPEFKRDLFRRRKATRVVFGANSAGAGRVNLSFPGFGPEHLLDAMRDLERETPAREHLGIRIVTRVSWFNTATPVPGFGHSLRSRLTYLLSPRTLKSSLDLIRKSRTLAFTGWQKEHAGSACVVDRGSPSPAWRADGTFTGSASDPKLPWRGFAWQRLTPLDAALAIAEEHRWNVIGRSVSSGPMPYAHELKALFAKHGYAWRVRRMAR
jgi:hypothetical protein